ncbi:hypothetical protein K474DRAFT_1661264 [Panus rudis PR-1116 ss-1]|nr:hypothetical protein K474DRAFT_1661264 [Panus rudis PR-1116 ss-1]
MLSSCCRIALITTHVGLQSHSLSACRANLERDRCAYSVTSDARLQYEVVRE